jgi:hypothetical protein
LLLLTGLTAEEVVGLLFPSAIAAACGGSPASTALVATDLNLA